MITLIEYPSCSTCKKAKRFLTSHHIDFETRHIVNDTPSIDELRGWINIFGITVDTFFNTRGKKYRELELKDKKDSLSEDAKLSLLSQDGMLVKRPLLLTKNHLLIGFDTSKWEAVLQVDNNT